MTVQMEKKPPRALKTIAQSCGYSLKTKSKYIKLVH